MPRVHSACFTEIHVRLLTLSTHVRLKTEWDSCEWSRIALWPCTIKDRWNWKIKPARVQTLVEQDQTVDGMSDGPKL